MEFRHLRYFLVLADELHFGRAAERLSISQPPLSWNIRQMEESIGARLFDRNSRGVRLTEAGRALVPAARALLTQAEEAARLARDVEQGVRGLLRVGYVGSMLYRGLPQMLSRFQENNPGLQVRSFELNSQRQVVELSHGQIDIGFVHTQRLPTGLDQLLLADEDFVCCLPAAHPLASQRKLTPAALKDEVFVMFSREASPDYHERVLAICTGAGFSPEIRHEVRHWISVVSLVAQGVGVSLVPQAVQRADIAGVCFVPLQSVHVRSQAYGVWRHQDDNPALALFLKELEPAASKQGKSTPSPTGRGLG